MRRARAPSERTEVKAAKASAGSAFERVSNEGFGFRGKVRRFEGSEFASVSRLANRVAAKGACSLGGIRWFDGSGFASTWRIAKRVRARV